MKNSHRMLTLAAALLLSWSGFSPAALAGDGLQEEEGAGKKMLTREQLLGSMPEGILNSLPFPAYWEDKDNVVFSFPDPQTRNTSYFNYNVKTKKRTPVTPKENKIQDPQADVKEAAMEKFNTVKDYDKAKNATFSPDASKIAYTKENNLYVYDAASGKEKQLTTDGSNLILNGWASWVYYEEILGRSSRYKAFWWSPDSKTLAYYRFDDSKVPMFPIYNSTGKHGFVTETRYPKAGDENPQVKIAFVDVENGDTVWADFDEKEDQYFGIPFWNADGSRFIVPWMPREQNHLVLYTLDPATGQKESIYNERQETWIDWMSDMHFTEDGFYMVRDTDLWEQIYFQSFDGKRLDKITDGKNWGVEILKVDQKEGAIYFTARREISTRVDFYRVDLKTKKIERLSTGDYSYGTIRLAPDNKHFVAVFSNSSTPAKVAVIGTDKKKEVDIVADSKGDKFDEYVLAIPEMLYIQTPDGYTIPAQVTWPVNLDPAKKYPVLISMYGGPNSGTVMDTWKGIGFGTQWWPYEGVIQISIDHRASGHCGKEGLNFLHRNLLTVELKDYIEWIKYLYTKPFVNREKIGITGFSYGGSMTMLAVTRGSDYFKYGIAGGGVYDYGLYDTHYTERYMDRPQDNPQGYENTRIMDHLSGYKGDKTNYVKITHGTSDDNVHMQNTMQLIEALQKSGKQFDLMLYPGAFHGYRGEQSMHSTVGDYIFWYRHLLDKEAPEDLLDRFKK